MNRNGQKFCSGNLCASCIRNYGYCAFAKADAAEVGMVVNEEIDRKGFSAAFASEASIFCIESDELDCVVKPEYRTSENISVFDQRIEAFESQIISFGSKKVRGTIGSKRNRTTIHFIPNPLAAKRVVKTVEKQCGSELNLLAAVSVSVVGETKDTAALVINYYHKPV